jgi:hypothetical protein
MTNHITRTMRFPIALASIVAFASCGGDSVVQPTFGSACSEGSIRAGETIEGEFNEESCVIPYHFYSGNTVAYASYKVSLQEGKGYWLYLQQIPNDTGLNEVDAVLSLFGKDENGASVPLAVSDDEARGIDGHDSEIFFIAPKSGTFNIVTSTYDISELGGYRLTMRECPVVATLDTAGTYASLPFSNSECVRHEMAGGDPSRIVLVAIPAGALETIDLSVSADFEAAIEVGGPGFDVFDNIYDEVGFLSSSAIPAAVSFGLGDVAGTLTLAVGSTTYFDPSGTFQVVMDRIAPVAPPPAGARMTIRSSLAGATKR